MAQIDDIIKGLENAVAQSIKDLASGVQVTLKSPPQEGGTPIDTGWASASWGIGVGSPYRTNGERPSENIESQVSAKDSETEITRVLLNTSYRLSGGDAFVSNNAPYILGLNEGTSRQAPRAFVQIAMARTIDSLRGKVFR